MKQTTINNQAINNEPEWHTPEFENIPDELKTQPWAVWQAEPRLDKDGKPTGKWNKAPRNPLTGMKVGANQPEKFGTFEEAMKAYKERNLSGVGVLLTGNGILGIDIDDGPKTLKSRPEVREWLEKAINDGAYCEISPSGKGFRLFTQGELSPNSRKKDGTLEIYDRDRFLTVTGNKVSGGSND